MLQIHQPFRSNQTVRLV